MVVAAATENAVAVETMRVTADADVTKMKTAVVILNWNTEGFLKEFLPSLLRSQIHSFKVSFGV